PAGPQPQPEGRLIKYKPRNNKQYQYQPGGGINLGEEKLAHNGYIRKNRDVPTYKPVHNKDVAAAGHVPCQEYRKGPGNHVYCRPAYNLVGIKAYTGKGMQQRK